MISIKKFLAANSERDRTPLHVVRILVHGIGEHAAGGDAADCEGFRESVQGISDALVDEIGSEELLVRAGSVLKALEDHNRRAARHQRSQTAELQNMVKMLASTVGIISAASKANRGILSDIERQVAVASELDDVRIIKARLAECLSDIRREAERHQSETDETIFELRRGLEQLRKSPAGALGDPGADLITGLPLRSAAEAAIDESAHGNSQVYIAVMVLDRLQVVNARFGREAGDEILLAFTRMVQKHLFPGDRMFRWGGPALLALLPRPASLERIRTEMGRVLDNKLDHTIQTPSRSVLIPIAARWCIFPTLGASRLNYQKIDAFAAGPDMYDGVAGRPPVLD